jgi:hypothetical protein
MALSNNKPFNVYSRASIPAETQSVMHNQVVFIFQYAHKKVSITIPTTKGDAAITANCLFKASSTVRKDKNAKLNDNAMQTRRTTKAAISTFTQHRPTRRASKQARSNLK